MEFSCEQIGLSKTELQDRIVDSIVDRMLSKYVTYSDESGYDCEDIKNTTIKNKLDAAIKSHIDAEIDRVADKYLGDMVPGLVEKFRLQETNSWGEPRGDSLSFTEYLVKRAENYMAEPVNFEGKSKKEAGSYSSSWKQSSTRMVYAIERHLHYHIENAMKTAIGDANKTLANGIVETVRASVGEVVSKINVNVKTK